MFRRGAERIILEKSGQFLAPPAIVTSLYCYQVYAFLFWKVKINVFGLFVVQAVLVLVYMKFDKIKETIWPHFHLAEA